MAGSSKLFGEPTMLVHGHLFGQAGLLGEQLPSQEASSPSTRPAHAEPLGIPLGRKVSACSIFVSSKNLPPFGPASCASTPHSPPRGECQWKSLLPSEAAAPPRPFSRVHSWFGKEVLPEAAEGSSPAVAALNALALSGDEDESVQAAARSLANLALLPELHDTLAEAESLDILSESMRTRSSECVGRFLAMALGRLAGSRRAAERMLAHDELLAALVVVANKSGGEWKQAARAMALLAKRAADAGARARLLRLGGAGPVVRLTQVNQTELQTDALCGLAAWCQDAEGVAALSAGGAWAAMLAAGATRGGAAPTTTALCGEVLGRALETAPDHVALDDALVDLVAAEAAGAGLGKAAHAAVLCRLAELGRGRAEGGSCWAAGTVRLRIACGSARVDRDSR